MVASLSDRAVIEPRSGAPALASDALTGGDAELLRDYQLIEDLSRVEPAGGLMRADRCLVSRAAALLGRYLPPLRAGNPLADIALVWLNQGGAIIATGQSAPDSARHFPSPDGPKEDRPSHEADPKHFLAVLRSGHEHEALSIQHWESAELSAVPVPTTAFPNIRFQRWLFPPHGSAACQIASVSPEQELQDVRRIACERWLLLSAVALGIAQAAFNYVFAYSQKRIAFGKAICHHQAVALKLADTATHLESARLLGYDACSSCGPHQNRFMHIHGVWEYMQEVAQEAALTAIQLMGGHGYLQLHPVQQWLCDIRFLRSYGELPETLGEVL